MPIWSKSRNVHLLTTEECGRLFDKSTKTIRRWLEKPTVYTEEVTQKHDKGATRVLYIDALTLGQPVSPAQMESLGWTFEGKTSDGHASLAWTSRMDIETSDGHSTKTLTEFDEIAFNQKNSEFSHGHEIDVHPSPQILTSTQESINRAHQLHQRLIPLQTMKRSAEKHRAVCDLANSLGTNERTIYRYLKALSRDGIRGLLEQKRGLPKGFNRVPVESKEVIKSAFLSNPPGTTAAQIHRTLNRAVPDLMKYERNGSLEEISTQTILRVRQEMMADPVLNVMLMNEDQRKEWARVWQGSVIAGYANYMWQIDMTRCDVLVVEPIPLAPFVKGGKRQIYRPRIQAIIDVYSGVIPGVSFSQDESQVQVDLAMRRALFPKTGRLAQHYPIHGVPEILYVDNGKIYCSNHFEGYMERLGVKVIHSKPKVSHTRGKVERFFGELHKFEKTLPGYVGSDAKNRDGEGVLKVYNKTLKWMQDPSLPSPEMGGPDPMKGERLLTIDEYQNYIAAWLVGEYHQRVIHGKTFLQHFIDTAPEHTRNVRNEEDMLLLMGQRETRKILNGEVKYNNESYWLPSGDLSKYPNGTEVLIITDIFTLGNDLMIARQEGGLITPLGIAELAPKNAISGESKAARNLKKAQKNLVKEQITTLTRQYQDANLRVPTALIKSLELNMQGAIEDSINANSITLTPNPSLALPLEKEGNGEGGNGGEGREEFSTSERSEFGKFLDEMEAEFDAFESDDPNEVLDHTAKRFGR
jgi:putative transposase